MDADMILSECDRQADQQLRRLGYTPTAGDAGTRDARNRALLGLYRNLIWDLCTRLRAAETRDTAPTRGDRPAFADELVAAIDGRPVAIHETDSRDPSDADPTARAAHAAPWDVDRIDEETA